MDDNGTYDPRAARRRDPEGVHSETWKQTLEDMEAIADERRREDWAVWTVFAAHTDTVSIDMGEEDRFGLVHVVPNNQTEPFETVYDPASFTEYLAYGTRVEHSMYLVTELIDPADERSILVASQYNVAMADGMVESAEEKGYLPSVFRTIDGTTLGTFEHEEYGPLLGRPQDDD